MSLVNCPNCGKPVSDAAPKCPGCGTELKNAPAKQAFCKYCGSPITPGSAFCPSCGKSQSSAPAQTSYQQPAQQPQPQAWQQPAQQPQPQTWQQPQAAQSNNTAQTTNTNTTVVVQGSRSNGLGTAGFVFAILALFLCWAPFVNFIVWFLGALFSFIGLFKAPRGLAIAGFILSFIGIIILVTVIGSVFAFMK